MTREELVWGLHAVRHALAAAPERALELWLAAGSTTAAVAEIESLAGSAGVSAQRVPRRTLDRMCAGARHQGAVLRRRAAPAADETGLEALLAGEDAPLLLVLDGIYDPGNLGACLRSADAAGACAVLVPMHRGAGLTSAARKAASGAAEAVPLVQVRNLARALAALAARGIRLVGTSAEAPCTLYECDLGGPLALVLGAEDRGLRRLTREACAQLVRIPMHGRVESLNVAAAAAVCLFEAVRQRHAR